MYRVRESPSHIAQMSGVEVDLWETLHPESQFMNAFRSNAMINVSKSMDKYTQVRDIYWGDTYRM